MDSPSAEDAQDHMVDEGEPFNSSAIENQEEVTAEVIESAAEDEFGPSLVGAATDQLTPAMVMPPHTLNDAAVPLGPEEGGNILLRLQEWFNFETVPLRAYLRSWDAVQYMLERSEVRVYQINIPVIGRALVDYIGIIVSLDGNLPHCLPTLVPGENPVTQYIGCRYGIMIRQLLTAMLDETIHRITAQPGTFALDWAGFSRQAMYERVHLAKWFLSIHIVHLNLLQEQLARHPEMLREEAKERAIFCLFRLKQGLDSFYGDRFDVYFALFGENQPIAPEDREWANQNMTQLSGDENDGDDDNDNEDEGSDDHEDHDDDDNEDEAEDDENDGEDDENDHDEANDGDNDNNDNDPSDTDYVDDGMELDGDHDMSSDDDD